MTFILEKMRWRYATKKFNSQKIPQETLLELLEAVSLTPSSMGLQPWKFIVVENQELREKLEVQAYNQKQITQASHLIILCRLSNLTHDHIEEYIKVYAKERNKNNEEMNSYRKMAFNFINNQSKETLTNWLINQVYIALGTLVTACAVEEIDACPMEGFRNSEFDRLLGLESLGLRSVLAVPIGYRSNDDKLAEANKVRFDLDSLLIFK